MTADKEPEFTHAEAMEQLGLEGSGKCERIGCEGAGDWLPFLEFYDPSGVHMGTAALGLRVCGSHAYGLELDDVCDDASWHYMVNGAFGHMTIKPERGRTRITVQRST